MSLDKKKNQIIREAGNIKKGDTSNVVPFCKNLDVSSFIFFVKHLYQN